MSQQRKKIIPDADLLDFLYNLIDDDQKEVSELEDDSEDDYSSGKSKDNDLDSSAESESDEETNDNDAPTGKFRYQIYHKQSR